MPVPGKRETLSFEFKAASMGAVNKVIILNITQPPESNDTFIEENKQEAKDLAVCLTSWLTRDTLNALKYTLIGM